MPEFTLIIGNKNYSSWSLRAWLALKQAAVPFEEVRIPLHQPNTDREILRYSPSGRVPLLIDGETKIWESIAICEYIAERLPKAHLWPEDAAARALARSVSAEMHAGFQALRQNMPMNIRFKSQSKNIPAAVEDDVRRITSLWAGCRARYGRGGPFLFGHFTIADAMFAPIVCRFRTCGVPLDSVSKAYLDAVLALPAMKEWIEAAEKEIEQIPEYDQVGVK